MKETLWNFSDLDTFYDVIKYEYRNIFYNDKVKLYNHRYQYMSKTEETHSKGAIESGYTELKEEDVHYYVNNYGARGKWEITPFQNGKIKIAFFGCSFTFGVGMDEEATFQSVVKNNWKTSQEVQIINLGYPGGSISKCVKLFKYLTNVYDIDIAIFVFPTHFRDEYINRDPDNSINVMNMIPNSEPTVEKSKWQLFYELMDDDNLLYKATKDLDLIEKISKEKNIASFYSSWDNKTYNHIKNNLTEQSRMLPYFKFLENMLPKGQHKGRARDGMHPGPLTHETFGEEIITHLNKHYLKKRDLI
jgi:hypothetical protein